MEHDARDVRVAQLAKFISECTSLFEDPNREVGINEEERKLLQDMLDYCEGDYTRTTTFLAEIDQSDRHVNDLNELCDLLLEKLISQGGTSPRKSFSSNKSLQQQHQDDDLPSNDSSQMASNPHSSDPLSPEVSQGGVYPPAASSSLQALQEELDFDVTTELKPIPQRTYGIDTITEGDELSGTETGTSAMDEHDRRNQSIANESLTLLDEATEPRREAATTVPGSADATADAQYVNVLEISDANLDDELDVEDDDGLPGGIVIRDESGDEHHPGASTPEAVRMAEDEAERAIALLSDKPIGVTVHEALAEENGAPLSQLAGESSTLDGRRSSLDHRPESSNEEGRRSSASNGRPQRPLSAPRGDSSLNLGILADKGLVPPISEARLSGEAIERDPNHDSKKPATTTIVEEITPGVDDVVSEPAPLKTEVDRVSSTDSPGTRRTSLSRREAAQRLRQSLLQDQGVGDHNHATSETGSQSQRRSAKLDYSDSTPVPVPSRPTSAAPARRRSSGGSLGGSLGEAPTSATQVEVSESQAIQRANVRKAVPPQIEITSPHPSTRSQEISTPRLLDADTEEGTSGAESGVHSITTYPTDIWDDPNIDKSAISLQIPISFIMREHQRLHSGEASSTQIEPFPSGSVRMSLSFQMAVQLWKQLSSRLSQVPIESTDMSSSAITPTDSIPTPGSRPPPIATRAGGASSTTTDPSEPSEPAAIPLTTDASESNALEEDPKSTISNLQGQIAKLRRLLIQERNLRQFGQYVSRVSPELLLDPAPITATEARKAGYTVVSGTQMAPSSSPTSACATSPSSQAVRTQVPVSLLKLDSLGPHQHQQAHEQPSAVQDQVLYTPSAVEEALKTQRRLLLDAFPTMQLPGHLHSLVGAEELLLRLRKESQNEISTLASKLRAAEDECAALQQALTRIANTTQKTAGRYVAATHAKRCYRKLVIHLAAATCRLRVKIRNRAQRVLKRLQVVARAAAQLDQTSASSARLQALDFPSGANARDMPRPTGAAGLETRVAGVGLKSNTYVYVPPEESSHQVVDKSSKALGITSHRVPLTDCLDEIEDLVTELEVSFGHIVRSMGQLHSTLNAFFTRGLELTRAHTQMKEQLEKMKLALARSQQVQARLCAEGTAGIPVQAGSQTTNGTVSNSQASSSQSANQVTNSLTRPQSARVGTVQQDPDRINNPILARMNALSNTIKFATGASLSKRRDSPIKRVSTARGAYSIKRQDNAPYTQGEAFVASTVTFAENNSNNAFGNLGLNALDNPELATSLRLGTVPGVRQSTRQPGRSGAMDPTPVSAGEVAARAVSAIPAQTTWSKQNTMKGGSDGPSWNGVDLGYPGPASRLSAAIAAGIGPMDEGNETQALISKIGAGVLLSADHGADTSASAHAGHGAGRRLFKSAFDTTGLGKSSSISSADAGGSQASAMSTKLGSGPSIKSILLPPPTQHPVQAQISAQQPQQRGQRSLPQQSHTSTVSLEATVPPFRETASGFAFSVR